MTTALPVRNRLILVAFSDVLICSSPILSHSLCPYFVPPSGALWIPLLISGLHCFSRRLSASLWFYLSLFLSAVGVRSLGSLGCPAEVARL